MAGVYLAKQPSPDEQARTVKELERFAADVKYLEDHRDTLTREHPDQWVAVFGGSVAALGDSLEDVVYSLDKNGVPVGGTVIAQLRSEIPPSVV